MKSITIPDAKKIAEVSGLISSKTQPGLILIASTNQSWVDFILHGIVGSYYTLGYTIVQRHDDDNIYSMNQIALKSNIDKNEKTIHYYGAIQDTASLEKSLLSAKNTITIGVLHVNSEDVKKRLQDMLKKDSEALDSIEQLVTCVISPAF